MEVQHQCEGVLRRDRDEANNQGFRTSKKARDMRHGRAFQAIKYNQHVWNWLKYILYQKIFYSDSTYIQTTCIVIRHIFKQHVITTTPSSSQERAVGADDDLVKEPKQLTIVDEAGLTPEPEKMGEKAQLCWSAFFPMKCLVFQQNKTIGISILNFKTSKYCRSCQIFRSSWTVCATGSCNVKS